MTLGGGILDMVVFHRMIWRRGRTVAHAQDACRWPALRPAGDGATASLRPTRERLRMPCANAHNIPMPYNADWAWRPQLWCAPLTVVEHHAVRTGTRIGDEIAVFHDGSAADVVLRQEESREMGLPPCGLRMDVSRFDGSFLSLVVDLPRQAIDGLKRTHLLRMDAVLELDRPMKVFARINLRHGPNTAQIIREMPVETRALTLEFDLAYTDLQEKRVEKAWVDLIFEEPEESGVSLHDLTFARRPRAAF